MDDSAFSVIGPGTTSAWQVSNDAGGFVLSVGVRTLDGDKSRSCSVTAQDIDVTAANEFMKTKFESMVIADQDQGSSHLTVYKLKLLGVDEDRYVSIESVGEQAGIDPVAKLSFFEAPKAQ